MKYVHIVVLEDHRNAASATDSICIVRAYDKLPSALAYADQLAIRFGLTWSDHDQFYYDENEYLVRLEVQSVKVRS